MFHVSRQRSYPDGMLSIDISVGGPSKAGKDILTPRYEGETKNLRDPRDAIKLAEEIYKKWDRDYSDEKKYLRVVDAKTFVFDFSKKGIEEANKWAEKIYTSMGKCGTCGKLMGNRPEFKTDEIPGQVFCVELCLARRYKELFGVEAPSTASKAKTKKRP